MAVGYYLDSKCYYKDAKVSDERGWNFHEKEDLSYSFLYI